MMKFTGYEAQGIEPLVAHSPLLTWMYGLWTVRQFAAGLGVVEILIAILIGLRPWLRKTSAIGSAAAVLMFLTILSFLVSTPGWEPILGGFPSCGSGWTILDKRCGSAWSRNMVTGRGSNPAREIDHRTLNHVEGRCHANT
jgi:uncharacterized membrane protein YkgB